MIQRKYYKKPHHLQKGLSLVIALWEEIFTAYITLKPAFIFFPEFYPGDHLPCHCCFNHLMIQPNCCITAMGLATTPP